MFDKNVKLLGRAEDVAYIIIFEMALHNLRSGFEVLLFRLTVSDSEILQIVRCSLCWLKENLSPLVRSSDPSIGESSLSRYDIRGLCYRV